MVADVGYPVRGGQTLLIAYFPWEASETDIEREFSKFSRVKRVHLVVDQSSRKPRCFGFVKFISKGDAEEALAATTRGLVQLSDTRGHVWHLKAEWTKSGDMVVDDSETELEVAKRKEERRSRDQHLLGGRGATGGMGHGGGDAARGGRGGGGGGGSGGGSGGGGGAGSRWSPKGPRHPVVPAPLPPLQPPYPSSTSPLGSLQGQGQAPMMPPNQLGLLGRVGPGGGLGPLPSGAPPTGVQPPMTSLSPPHPSQSAQALYGPPAGGGGGGPGGKGAGGAGGGPGGGSSSAGASAAGPPPSVTAPLPQHVPMYNGYSAQPSSPPLYPGAGSAGMGAQGQAMGHHLPGEGPGLAPPSAGVAAGDGTGGMGTPPEPLLRDLIGTASGYGYGPPHGQGQYPSAPPPPPPLGFTSTQGYPTGQAPYGAGPQAAGPYPGQQAAAAAAYATAAPPGPQGYAAAAAAAGPQSYPPAAAYPPQGYPPPPPIGYASGQQGYAAATPGPSSYGAPGPQGPSPYPGQAAYAAGPAGAHPSYATGAEPPAYPGSGSQSYSQDSLAYPASGSQNYSQAAYPPQPQGFNPPQSSIPPQPGYGSPPSPSNYPSGQAQHAAAAAAAAAASAAAAQGAVYGSLDGAVVPGQHQVPGGQPAAFGLTPEVVLLPGTTGPPPHGDGMPQSDPGDAAGRTGTAVATVAPANCPPPAMAPPPANAAAGGTAAGATGDASAQYMDYWHFDMSGHDRLHLPAPPTQQPPAPPAAMHLPQWQAPGASGPAASQGPLDDWGQSLLPPRAVAVAPNGNALSARHAAATAVAVAPGGASGPSLWSSSFDDAAAKGMVDGLVGEENGMPPPRSRTRWHPAGPAPNRP